jgi:hypothetical protein
MAGDMGKLQIVLLVYHFVPDLYVIHQRDRRATNVDSQPSALFYAENRQGPPPWLQLRLGRPYQKWARAALYSASMILIALSPLVIYACWR